jgi:hypothetical protein
MYASPERVLRGMKVNNYHVVIAQKGGITNTIGPWRKEDVNEVIQKLAMKKYDYEREIKDMQKMFGNYNKCGGVLFRNCSIRSDHKSNRENNCAENCPRVIPTYEEYLIKFVRDIVIIICSEAGEVWRNRPGTAGIHGLLEGATE